MIDIRAAVVRDPDGPFSFETITLDDPRSDEVLVRVLATGVCHTDTVAKSLSLVRDHLPFVLGHEGAGIVERVGSGVVGVSVGDHAILSYASCGSCRMCVGGEPAYCEQFYFLNGAGTRADGSTGAVDAAGVPVHARWFAQSSFATYCLAQQRNVVVVDRDLPLDLLAPFGCGLQTGAGAVVNTFQTKVGDSVAVFGAGAVGLGAIMAAKAAGARTIVAVDLHANRLDIARELGATHTFNGSAPDLAATIVREVGMLNAALDTTSVPAIIRAAVETLRPRGQAGYVSSFGGDITLPAGALDGGRSLTLLIEGSSIPQLFLPVLIGLWREGKFPVEKLVRHYPFEQLDQAEKDSLSGDVVKPVVVMESGDGVVPARWRQRDIG